MMFRILLLVLVSLLLPACLQAQQHPFDPLPPVSMDSLLHGTESNDSLVQEPRYLTRISILAPMIQEEISVGIYKTLVFTVEPIAAYLHFEQLSLQGAEARIAPTFGIQSRFYTNLEKRRYLQKSTENYSGNYVALMASGFYTDHAPGLAAGILTGWQRNMGKIGFINISTGVGNLWYNAPGQFIFLLNLSAGFTL